MNRKPEEISEEDNTKRFITKGDNNQIDDETPVSASDIIGKWTGTKINGLGKFIDFVTTKKGFFICVLIPIAIFFIFELYKFITVLIEAKQVVLSEEDEEEIKRKAVEEYLAKKDKEEKSADTDTDAANADEIESTENTEIAEDVVISEDTDKEVEETVAED